MTNVILAENGKTGIDEFDDLRDWGLWYNTPDEVDYTRRCWELLHYHKRLPEDGGLSEQDAYRIDDMMTLSRVYAYHHRRLYVEGAIGEDPPYIPAR